MVIGSGHPAGVARTARTARRLVGALGAMRELEVEVVVADLGPREEVEDLFPRADGNGAEPGAAERLEGGAEVNVVERLV